MGYVIQYSDGDCKKSKYSGRSGLPAMTAAFFLAFLLLTKAFWPAGSRILREIFIPGDPEITGGAISNLVDDLRAGEPLKDSVAAFCSEILAHAEIPD